MPSAYSEYIQDYENSTAGDEPQRPEIAASDFLRQVELRESDREKNLDLSDDAHESNRRHRESNEPKRRSERRENTHLRCGSPRTENRPNRFPVAKKSAHIKCELVWIAVTTARVESAAATRSEPATLAVVASISTAAIARFAPAPKPARAAGWASAATSSRAFKSRPVNASTKTPTSPIKIPDQASPESRSPKINALNSAA